MSAGQVTTASAEQTAGSAANALSRAYQQKRDSSSAPTVSAKDAEGRRTTCTADGIPEEKGRARCSWSLTPFFMLTIGT